VFFATGSHRTRKRSAGRTGLFPGSTSSKARGRPKWPLFWCRPGFGHRLIGRKWPFGSPQTGHTQSLGRSSNGTPGGMGWSGSITFSAPRDGHRCTDRNPDWCTSIAFRRRLRPKTRSEAFRAEATRPLLSEHRDGRSNVTSRHPFTQVIPLTPPTVPHGASRRTVNSRLICVGIKNVGSCLAEWVFAKVS